VANCSRDPVSSDWMGRSKLHRAYYGSKKRLDCVRVAETTWRWLTISAR